MLIYSYLRSQKHQKIGSREWFALCVILSFTNLVVCPPPPSASRKEEDPLFTSKIVSGGKYKTTAHSEKINDEFRKSRTEVTLPVTVTCGVTYKWDYCQDGKSIKVRGVGG